MKKAFQLLMPILIAVGLGPMIAGLFVCLVALFTTTIDRTGALHFTDLPAMFCVYIIFSYILGAPIAFLAGLLVSIWMISRPPGFTMAIGSSVISVGLYRLVAELGFLSQQAPFRHATTSRL